MRSNKTRLMMVASALMLLPTLASAETSDASDKAGSYNMMLIALVTLIVVLLFVIGMLANTLRQLGFTARDKMQKDKQAKSPIVKTLLLLLALSLPAFHSFAAEAAAVAVKTAVAGAETISGVPVMDFYTIMSVIGLELVVIFGLVISIRTLLRLIIDKPEVEAEAKAAPKHSWFWDKFNAAATIEHEKDILLDHNYDGIQELDNSLPPWWKYGFYLTIIVGCIYIYRYHISHDGPSQHDEYVAEMQKGADDKAAYLAKSANNVDENTVVLLADPAEIAQGKEMFQKTCIACHLADGGGNVGPNLTDEYWLHGGGIKDIFKSIKYGWQDKGMKSWKDDFSPKQIQQLASFVKSLKGTHPLTPKAPQGELYIEASQAPKVVDTSAKAGKVVTK